MHYFLYIFLIFFGIYAAYHLYLKLKEPYTYTWTNIRYVIASICIVGAFLFSTAFEIFDLSEAEGRNFGLLCGFIFVTLLNDWDIAIIEKIKKKLKI